MSDTLPPLPEPTLEDVAGELWGQNIVYPALYTADQMRFYAAAALAAAVSEPVAWIQPDHLQKAKRAPFLCRVEPTQRFADFVPLYAAPPQREPLTEEQIEELNLHYLMTQSAKFTIVRAVERAHGITKEQP